MRCMWRCSGNLFQTQNNAKGIFFPMNFYKISHLLELVQIPMFQKNFKFSFITFFLQVVKSTLVEEENLEVIRGNFI